MDWHFHAFWKLSLQLTVSLNSLFQNHDCYLFALNETFRKCLLFMLIHAVADFAVSVIKSC